MFNDTFVFSSNTSSRRLLNKNSWSLSAAALALSLGCGGQDTGSLGEQSFALRTPTVVASFDPTQGQLPESVTANGNGNFYLSMTNTAQKLSPNLALSLYGQIPTQAGNFAGGVKFGPDGDLYICSAGFDPTQDAAGIYKIQSNGTVTLVSALDPTGFPDDLAFDNHGNLFVTDPFLGRIYKIDSQGNSSIFLEDSRLLGNAANPALVIHAFGVDGIAFDAAKRYLYVDNLDYGNVYRIAVDDRCNPGPLELYASDSQLVGADGMAFDVVGNLYVAVDGQDQLARISPDRKVSVIAQGSPLDGPSSLVFGSHDSDRTTLYISNFAIARDLGVKPGTPQPSLSKIQVPFGGLKLE